MAMDKRMCRHTEFPNTDRHMYIKLGKLNYYGYLGHQNPVRGESLLTYTFPGKSFSLYMYNSSQWMETHLLRCVERLSCGLRHTHTRYQTVRRTAIVRHRRLQNQHHPSCDACHDSTGKSRAVKYIHVSLFLALPNALLVTDFVFGGI